jgi:outer membrane immunogenic protein
MRIMRASAIALVLCLGAAQNVFAADLPVKAARAPAAIVASTWTGCFVGGHVGGAWGRTVATNATAPFVGEAIASSDPSGVVAGGQIGCDYQAGSFVIGLQGDGAWTNLEGTGDDLVFAGARDRVESKWLASATGRLGYAWDRWLAYVRGGGAWIRNEYTFFAPTGVAFAEAKETRPGWTVGAGLEYLFTPGVSAFVEYDYYDFGDRVNTFTVLTTGAFFGDASIRHQVHVAKVGVNFRFGGR